jgi:hypothetical protein
MLPVKVTSIDGDKIYWEYRDKHRIQLGSFHLTPDTRVFIGNDKLKVIETDLTQSDDEWLCVYNDVTKDVYSLSRMK